jgi:hypothetical protein
VSGATGSRLSQRGDPIEATIIAPVSVQGRILVPQGSRLLGSIAQATALGFGLKHATASLAYTFQTLQLPDGTAIPVHTQLVEVDTAKEAVDDRGTVHGIHPVVSLSSSLAFYTVPLLLIEPTLGAPVWGIKCLVVPSANPEIYFPAGTELLLRLTTAVILPPRPIHSFVPTKPFSRGEGTDLVQWLKNSAPQASLGSRPSDVVNLLFNASST